MARLYQAQAWPTELKTLAPGVHAYIQAGGSWGWNNAGVVEGTDEVLLIDTLFTVPLTEALLAEVRARTNKPIRWLMYTHHHGDHVFGSGLLPEATVVATKMCKWVLDNHPANMQHLIQRYPHFDFTGATVQPPQVVFADWLQLQLGSRPVELIHRAPAHTLGDAIAYLPEEKLVFCADVLFLYSTPAGPEGSFRGWLEYMEYLVRLPATIFVPGHGPVCGREGVLACYEYLYRFYLQGVDCFHRGVPVAEAARRIDLAAWRSWVNWERVLVNLERLYRELGGATVYDSPIDMVAIAPLMQALREQG